MGDQPEAAQFLGNDPAHPLNDEDLARVRNYQYDPLPSGKFIRMLTLYQGLQNDPLKGKLELFEVGPSLSSESVNSPLASKSYEPLSYVWGPPHSNENHQIAISTNEGYGCLRLTASLYGALKGFDIPIKNAVSGSTRSASIRTILLSEVSKFSS